MKLKYKRYGKKLVKSCQWIADNDEPTEKDQETISQQLTVLLVADLFDVDAYTEVAEIILELRHEKEAKEHSRKLALGYGRGIRTRT